MKSAGNEKDIKNFIASYPWLLDIKYENVPELDKTVWSTILKERRSTK